MILTKNRKGEYVIDLVALFDVIKLDFVDEDIAASKKNKQPITLFDYGTEDDYWNFVDNCIRLVLARDFEIIEDLCEESKQSKVSYYLRFRHKLYPNIIISLRISDHPMKMRERKAFIQRRIDRKFGKDSGYRYKLLKLIINNKYRFPNYDAALDGLDDMLTNIIEEALLNEE